MFRDFKFPAKSQAKYVRALCNVLTSLMSHREVSEEVEDQLDEATASR